MKLATQVKKTIASLAKEQPHPSWRALAAYDWDAELLRLEGWATALLKREPPKRPVTGYLFGLFNPVERGRATAELYLAGFQRDGDEWWYGTRAWWPKGRYSGSRALRELYALAYAPDGLGNEIEYPLGLEFSLAVARSLAKSVGPQLWLQEQAKVRIAAGFDSGDIIEVGEVTRRGFRATSP